MTPTWLLYIFALLGGTLAGIINTLAGSGSLVTLPILTMLGLPAPIANATNRVGVVFQCAVASATFHKKGLLKLERATLWWLVPTLLGSLIGAMIAVDVDERAMNIFIGVVMVVMLGVTLRDSKSWLESRAVVDDEAQEEEEKAKRPSLPLLLGFFLIGIYGGFIQAGVGVMLLIALVSGAGFDVARANGVKMLVALGLAGAALALFMAHDMVDWPMGLLMAAGQSLGAWLGVKFLAEHPSAHVWVRRLLIGVIALGIVRFLAPELHTLLSTTL
jgi:uncharacterized membrane protein YfcA